MSGPPCVVRSRSVVGLWGRFFVTLYRRATALICLEGCVAPPVRAYPGGSGSPGAGCRPSVPVWCVVFDYGDTISRFTVNVNIQIKIYRNFIFQTSRQGPGGNGWKAPGAGDIAGRFRRGLAP